MVPRNWIAIVFSLLSSEYQTPPYHIRLVPSSPLLPHPVPLFFGEVYIYHGIYIIYICCIYTVYTGDENGGWFCGNISSRRFDIIVVDASLVVLSTPPPPLSRNPAPKIVRGGVLFYHPSVIVLYGVHTTMYLSHRRIVLIAYYYGGPY